MSKLTVVFSTTDAVIDGRYPWVDSDGNKVQPESCGRGDAFKEIKELKQDLAKCREENARILADNELFKREALG